MAAPRSAGLRCAAVFGAAFTRPDAVPIPGDIWARIGLRSAIMLKRDERKERRVAAACIVGLLVIAWLIDQTMMQGHYTWLAVRVPLALSRELLGLPHVW